MKTINNFINYNKESRLIYFALESGPDQVSETQNTTKKDIDSNTPKKLGDEAQNAMDSLFGKSLDNANSNDDLTKAANAVKAKTTAKLEASLSTKDLDHTSDTTYTADEVKMPNLSNNISTLTKTDRLRLIPNATAEILKRGPLLNEDNYKDVLSKLTKLIKNNIDQLGPEMDALYSAKYKNKDISTRIVVQDLIAKIKDIDKEGTLTAMLEKNSGKNISQINEK